MGRSPGDESLQLKAYKLKGINGTIYVFLFFLKLFLFYCSSFQGMMRADPAVDGRGNV